MRINSQKQTFEKIRDLLRYQIESETGIQLTSLSSFDERHLVALIGKGSVSLKKIFERSGASISHARTIVGTGQSNHFQSFFIHFGLSEHFVRLLNSKNRYEYLVTSGYGKKIIVDYAERLIDTGAYNKKPLDLARELTQAQLKKDKVIKTLFGGKLGQTCSLRIDLGLAENNLSQPTWPQDFLQKHAIDAREAYQQTKDELSIEGLDWSWYTAKDIRAKTKFGARLLNLFNNSIHKMVEHFEFHSPHNVANYQNAWQDPEFIKQKIKSALKSANKQITDLPNVSIPKLIEDNHLSPTFPSAIHRWHKKPYTILMCELFPEHSWKPYNFNCSGVPDKYWFNDAGELNRKAATEAIELVLMQRFHANDVDTPEKKLKCLSMLTQSDMNFYGFSSLSSPSSIKNGQGWTWAKVMKTCFPGVVLVRERTKSALVFINLLKEQGMIPKDLDPLMHLERNIRPVSKKARLYDDLHLPIQVNGTTKNIVFEIQGPHHADKGHYYYSESVAKNDIDKFIFHHNAQQPLYYVTSGSLYDDTYFSELMAQGLDIKAKTIQEINVLDRAKHIEEHGFAAEGFCKSIREKLANL
ncbi:hypothetical protein VSAK1_26065 [Vibrio mediterranei AK1]|uniref:hypothetical protein n=1 Tax=Vibrio mediterranei TaxID=689 RepID=UPI0001541CF6|nr:hypothetical protein [Vibrio mediterranei]EDL53707.1 hypothetical protein VSAK1_26065 [Vibrio mediterranei AK1]